MVTKYEQKLIDYWANWKPGMGPFTLDRDAVVDYKPIQPVDMSIEIELEDLAETLWDII